MGKAYKTGKQTFSARARKQGHDLFVSGYSTKQAAKEELDRQLLAIKKLGAPQHGGPQRTTLAQALQDFGLEHLPNLKGAAQEARRINKYLAACGLQLLEVLPNAPQGESSTAKPAELGVYKGLHASLRLRPRDAVASIPNGLGPYRKALIAKTSGSDTVRQRLACTLVADITAMEVQLLMTALSRDGLAPASVGLERALLRGFFNYARRTWRWSAPGCNPAAELKMPKIKNERDRVMSVDEQQLLDQAIEEGRNSLMGPVISLLTETAMRVGEPLQHAKWGDVDWSANILRLRDGKAGAREVPLSPKAVEILRSLNPGKPDEPIVRISYEAVKAGWRRACERAGVKNLHLHDLRHTAATRMALKTGNLFIVQALTGHQDLDMLRRYVNVKASDVVAVMHDEKPSSLMAGIAQPVLEQPEPVQPSVSQAAPASAEGLGAPASGSFQLTPAELQALVGAAVTQAVAALQTARQP
jgi:integrase